ncbi:replicative DNA helicase [Bacillus pumilus]|uniref:replicative DNA helicase n=1 Tax=Bacillus TaxID=1386 RepID=UPI000D043EB4|nr:replicative DNA helicase [Bacillus pumilus]MCY7500728.1 replicative DNA helicase [Bacillus pumilus]MCY7526486.1 replicative DNA helicase [Bacillus pumilus]MED4439009.1 replicative DNA helicase [Bacillus pumilus]MED4491402.1 replicative DNA helicase [Bacillus pumilus]MED4628054.1 replicative DNA helicase [Bacillus pumilus]
MQNLRNVEAEQFLLGCIILEGDLIKETALEPRHFAEERHKRIFEAMREVDKLGKPVELANIAASMGDLLNSIGGFEYLTNLASTVPSKHAFETYETLIYEAFRLRDLQSAALAFANAPCDEGITELYQKTIEVQEVGVKANRTKMDVLTEIFMSMEEDQGDLTGVDTGLADLNAMTGGWQKSDLIIVAARPSMGKTAFALNLGCNNALKGGVTDIFSLEMSDTQLTHRMLSSLGRIEGTKWRNPKKYFSDQDYDRANKAMGEYEKLDIYIHDQPTQTVADIRSQIRKTKKDHPDQDHLIIIDYLQLITPIGKFESKNYEVGAITKELKNMARSFNVPIILLSQLSRGVEQRQDKRPMMSDLRDSGSIEQDADIVTFLYRDDYYNKDSEQKNIVEIIFAKQRNGEVGTINAAFMKEYGRFVNLSRQMEAAL